MINKYIDDLGLDVLTPVEEVDGLILKREDKFRPFAHSTANGTKLRQGAYIMLDNLDKVRNGVLTCCSIHSPQAVLVSAMCQYLQVPCTVFYGSTTYERLLVLDMPKLVKEHNGDYHIASKMGRISVLKARAKERQQHSDEFIVEHGMDLTDNVELFIKAVSRQVENLPNELDNLVITCGSGISTTGILFGLKLYNKKVKRITLVGVAPNREEKVKNNLKMLQERYSIDTSDIEFNYVDLFNTKGFKYEKKEFAEHCGIEFHPNYEAKTYNWLKNNIDYKNEKTCFWVVGSGLK